MFFRSLFSHPALLSALFSVVCLPPLADAAGKGTGRDQRSAYPLPKDPKAVVISLDYKGGFTPPRKKNTPALSILRDGTVLMPDRYGLSQDVTGKISPRELQQLLHFIIEENQFLKYDAAKVKEKIRKAAAGRFLPRIADAPTTVISVQPADRKHTASHYALRFAASQHKSVRELQQLAAIERRLTHLMYVVRLGGPAAVEKMVQQANTYLKEKYPQAKPLTAAHLQSVSLRRDGTKIVSFYRRGQQPDGKPNGGFTSVFLQIPPDPDDEPVVRVNWRKPKS